MIAFLCGQAAAQGAASPTAVEAVPLEAAGHLLPQASGFAAAVDDSFVLLAWFAVFLVIVVAGSFALLVLRPASAAAAIPRSLRIWAAVGALALGIVFLLQGAQLWADMQTIPRGALPIRVAFEDKGWSFTYPNGFVSNELHLPLERAVHFQFSAGAQPYTFAVPAFRMQCSIPMDEQSQAWVLPTLAGEYSVRSRTTTTRNPDELVAQITVHPAGGYEKWYQDISGPPLDLPPIELGARSYQMRGCTQCHTIDGNKLIGPSFLGFFAREHRMTDGSVVAPSAEYIKESLLDPQAKVVEGFDPVMPSFRGRLHELEIAGLAAYIESLK